MSADLEQHRKILEKVANKIYVDPTPEQILELQQKYQEHNSALIQPHYPDELKAYLRSSEYRVPPLPHELNEDGEPTEEHLLLHGGALKPGAAKHRMPLTIDFTKLNLSFGGCGFLGMYHIGVMNAIMHFVPECRISKVCGTSAGAIAAAALVANVEYGEMANQLMLGISLARDHISQYVTFPHIILNNILKETLDDVLPPNVHLLAAGRLFISVTDTTTSRNVIVSSYANKRAVIDTVLASARIPGFTGILPVKVANTGCIDGGFTSNLPQFLKNVITVSPFASNAHISPLDNAKTRSWTVSRFHFADQGSDLTLHNLRRVINVIAPPSPEVLAQLFEDGFSDACRFLRVNGVIKCSRCLIVKTKVNRSSKKTPETKGKGKKRQEEANKVAQSNESLDQIEPELINNPKHIHDRRCSDKIDCDRTQAEKVFVPNYFENRQRKLWALQEEIERIKKHSITYQLLNVGWWLATHATPLVLLQPTRFGEYLNNPGKGFIQLADKLTDVLSENDDDLVRGLETLVNEGVNALLPNAFKETINVDHVEKRRDMFRQVEIKLADMGAGGEDEDGDDALLQDEDYTEDEMTQTDDDRQSEIGSNSLEATNAGTSNHSIVMNRELFNLKVEEDMDEAETNSESLSHGVSSQEDALLLQNTHLLAIMRSSNNPSRSVSRNISRCVSRAMSRSNSRPTSRPHSRSTSVAGSRQLSRDSSRVGSRTASRRQSVSENSDSYKNKDTLDNVRFLTETREATMGYFLTKPNGEILTMNLYDVSDTDPANILGDDIFEDSSDGDYSDHDLDDSAGASASGPLRLVRKQDVAEFDESQMERLLRKISSHQELRNLKTEEKEKEEEDGK